MWTKRDELEDRARPLGYLKDPIAACGNPPMDLWIYINEDIYFAKWCGAGPAERREPCFCDCQFASWDRRYASCCVIGEGHGQGRVKMSPKDRRKPEAGLLPTFSETFSRRMSLLRGVLGIFLLQPRDVYWLLLLRRCFGFGRMRKSFNHKTCSSNHLHSNRVW